MARYSPAISQQLLLQGKGSRIRSIRLEPFSLLDTAAVRALLRQAIRPHASDLAQAPKRSTPLKSVARKRRARRPVARSAGRRS